MRLSRTTLALASLVILAGCKPGQIVVTAEIDVQDPETGETVMRPIADLEIEILPFDRDVVFDSLEAAFGIPEIVIGPDANPAELSAVNSIVSNLRVGSSGELLFGHDAWCDSIFTTNRR